MKAAFKFTLPCAVLAAGGLLLLGPVCSKCYETFQILTLSLNSSSRLYGRASVTVFISLKSGH